MYMYYLFNPFVMDTQMKVFDVKNVVLHMFRVHMSQTQHIVVQKQIRVMENRLDKSLVRFNSALATNAQLRSMIDHLRQERSVFEGIYKKLQRVSGTR